MSEADVEWLRENNVAKTIDSILRQVMDVKPNDVPSAIAAAAENLDEDAASQHAHELVTDTDFRSVALAALATVKFKKTLAEDDDMQTAAAVSLARTKFKEPEDKKSDGSAFASLVKSKFLSRSATSKADDTDDEEDELQTSLAGAAFVALAKEKFKKALDEDDTDGSVSTEAFKQAATNDYLKAVRTNPDFVQATYTQLYKKKLKKVLDSDDPHDTGAYSSQVRKQLLNVTADVKEVAEIANKYASGGKKHVARSQLDNATADYAELAASKFKSAIAGADAGVKDKLYAKIDAKDKDVQAAEFALLARGTYKKALVSKDEGARKYARLAKKNLKSKLKQGDPDFADAALAALAAIKLKGHLDKDDEDDEEGHAALNELSNTGFAKHSTGSAASTKQKLKQALAEDDDDPDFTTAAFVSLAKTKFKRSLGASSSTLQADPADSDEEDDMEEDNDDDPSNDVDFRTAAMAALATAKFKSAIDTGDKSVSSKAVQTLMTSKMKEQIDSGSDMSFTTAAAVALAKTKFKNSLGEDKKTPSFKSVGLAALAKVKFSNSIETEEEKVEIEVQTMEALKKTKFKDQLSNPAFKKEVQKAIDSPDMKKELDSPQFQDTALVALAAAKFKKPISNNADFAAQAAKSVGKEPVLAVRREIRTMPRAEQERFLKAVAKLQENVNGPETSEFFRLAGYHGWPSNYCAHGQENFPGWHRAYLLDFEKALQKADKELGNDGNIGLPYWDWSDWESSREIIPESVKEMFSLPPGTANHPDVRIERKPDWQIKRNILKAKSADSANACLHATEHWKHASTRWVGRKGPSVEVSHNSIHVAVGWPMGSVKFAAFDIMFWLHHCNVDRIYEGYLAYEGDSAKEFSAYQSMLVEDDKNEANLWKEPLDPFTLPGTDTPFTCADTFDTKKLGYVYDNIPTKKGIEVTEPPTMAHFPSIKIVDLDGKCYQVHVFVTPKGVDPNPGTDPEGWPDHQYYAGMTAVFGRGPGCVACEHRKPMDLFVDITENLKKLKLSRYEVQLTTWCVETSTPEYKVVALADTPLPQPDITGSLFESEGGDVAKGGAHKGEEAKAVQKFMAAYGYYDGKIDGDFGDYTNGAVQQFQESAALKKDGVVGPNTKKQIKRARYLNKDAFSGKPDPLITKLKPADAGRQPIKYWIGTAPGYLKRNQYASEVAEALRLWGATLGWKFKRTRMRTRAVLQFRFVDLDENNLFPFDPTVKGATLARANGQVVELDLTEHWATQREKKPKEGSFRLLPALLHCVGAALGLQHSNKPEDVMSPYYDEKGTRLSENDRQRIAELYA